jgi:hypothetical protein
MCKVDLTNRSRTNRTMAENWGERCKVELTHTLQCMVNVKYLLHSVK